MNNNINTCFIAQFIVSLPVLKAFVTV